MRALRILGPVAVFVAYALLSWALMARWPQHPWAVAILFGPVVLGLLGGGLLRKDGWSLAGGIALLGALVLLTLRGGVTIERLYVAQHAAIHAMLAWTFGSTLRPGRTALITHMAEILHRDFAPGQREYTRRLTGLWCVFFVGMILLSLLLYAFTPWAWWSFFCTILTPAAAGLFFLVEHLWRMQHHPHFVRVELAKVMQTWRSLGTSR